VQSRLRKQLALAAAWSVPGVIAAFQTHLLAVYTGDDLDFPGPFLWRFLPWQIWAVATPLIIALYRRFPVRKSSWWKSLPIHLATNMIVGALDITASFFLGVWLVPAYFEGGELPLIFTAMLLKGSVLEGFIYWGVIAIYLATEYQQRYRETLLARAQMEARLVEAQLDALQMQLHPHFLFNTLNAISVLVRKGDGAGAIKMLGGLSDLLRRSLSRVRLQHVSLGEELEFLERYLDIETVRFPDRLKVQIDADPSIRQAKVPNMILQPIVENALKHGLAPRASGGSIEIVARSRDQALVIEIRDDGVGLSAPSSSGGVGLAHVKKRLEQLYPGRHRFELEPRPGGGVVATLEIPLELEGAR
jgi:two-component system, LytTR family, sensor kinase